MGQEKKPTYKKEGVYESRLCHHRFGMDPCFIYSAHRLNVVVSVRNCCNSYFGHFLVRSPQRCTFTQTELYTVSWRIKIFSCIGQMACFFSLYNSIFNVFYFIYCILFKFKLSSHVSKMLQTMFSARMQYIIT
jgi:hypothetical protein